MAHPKSRVSKARKNKRRTHHKAAMPQLTVCKTTGETHMMHRAYWHEGNMFYKGQMVIEGKTAEVED
ncbi:MAG: 50S ribosomal protein L32 [Saprospiraceae bacterium]|nr:50S ribosomal protein L32 [Saprospiraceae bacterium]